MANQKHKEDVQVLRETVKIAEHLIDELGWLSNYAIDPKRPKKGGQSTGRSKGSHSDPTADAATDPYAQRVRKQYANAREDIQKALGLLRHAETSARLAMGVGKQNEAYDVIASSDDLLPKAELRSLYARQQARHQSGGGYGES